MPVDKRIPTPPEHDDPHPYPSPPEGEGQRERGLYSPEGKREGMGLILRFNVFHRVLHAVMAVSFIGLVASGMPLKYAEAPWAAWLMKLLGGYHSAGLGPQDLRGRHIRIFCGPYRICSVRHRLQEKTQFQPVRTGIHGSVGKGY